MNKGAVILESARATIADYQPESPREWGFQERMLQLLATAAPTSRSQFDPGHLTASAFVLSPERDALLLILHKKLGLWLQPGGHVENADTSLLGAACREVAEEVGLERVAALQPGAIDLDIHAIPARKDEPAHEHFDVRFCLQAATLDIASNDEVADARWVPLAEIAQLTTDESVLRVARKLARKPSIQG